MHQGAENLTIKIRLRVAGESEGVREMEWLLMVVVVVMVMMVVSI